MKRILVLLVALVLSGSLAACNRDNSPSGAMLSASERKAVLEFSEPKMGNLLDGWNEDDYAVFSKDFDQNVLKSIPREEFEKLRNDEFTGLGRFFSREVESVVQRSDGSYTVIYYAVFGNDDEVLIRVKFQADEPHQIGGLSFTK